MRALLHLTWIRLTEQPVKLLYLAATLATVILTWIVLSAFAAPSLLSGSNVIKSELGLANGRAQNTPFPLHYIPRIQQMPGVGNVQWLTLAFIACADGSGNNITVSGLGGDYDASLREKGASAAEIAQWHATENGVLVAHDTARKCGISAGMTISPKNFFGAGELPLHVIAVLPERGGFDDRGMEGHYDYLNRFMQGPVGSTFRDAVIRAFVQVTDPTRLNQVASAIEEEFQSSDPPLEVVVLGESGSLVARFGQVQALLLLIMLALAMCVSLVFIAITAHLIARRRANMAVLQTLGFSRKIQFIGLLLELAGIIIVGTTLGITAGYGVLTLLTPWAAETLLSGALRPIDGAILILLPALLLLLIFTMTWPALQIAKLKPIDYLHL